MVCVGNKKKKMYRRLKTLLSRRGNRSQKLRFNQCVSKRLPFSRVVHSYILRGGSDGKPFVPMGPAPWDDDDASQSSSSPPPPKLIFDFDDDPLEPDPAPGPPSPKKRGRQDGALLRLFIADGCEQPRFFLLRLWQFCFSLCIGRDPGPPARPTGLDNPVPVFSPSRLCMPNPEACGGRLGSPAGAVQACEFQALSTFPGRQSAKHFFFGGIGACLFVCL